LKEQIDGYQREIFHMQAQARVHRADKDVKIAELTSTIRALSARTDMHAQVVAARQEVETERLTNHHLRADVDMFRLMLEDEQRKLLQARKDAANLQSQIDSTMVIQTVTNIPGVSAPTVIEMMAGQITYYQSEASRARSAHAEATAQMKKLQRIIALHQQQERKHITRQQKLQSPSYANYPNPRSNSSVPSYPSSRQVVAQPQSSYDDTAEHVAASVGASPVRSNANNYSLLRPSDEDFGPTNELNHTEAIVVDDDDYVINAPYSLRTDSNMSNFSIIVDAEATPKQVIESLDRAMLVQRVLEQEAAINDLTELIDGLKADKLRVERGLINDWDASDESKYIEYENSQRKQELLRAQIDEYKHLLDAAKQRNLELEKAMSDLQLDQLIDSNRPAGNSHYNNNKQSNRIITSLFEQQNYHTTDDLSTSNNSSQAVSGLEISYEENKKELESTKILLRERTTQLKIIMETLDTLQVAGASVKKVGTRFDAEDEQLFNYRSSSNSDFASTLAAAPALVHEAPIYSEGVTQTTSWASQALIKRVVELTTELSSQHALASLEARKVEDLELTNHRQSKECNRLRLDLHRFEEASAKTLLQVNAMNNRLREVSREHIDAIAALKGDNDNLTSKMREYEEALNECELRCSTLTQQAQVSEQKDLMTWLEFITSDNQKIISSSMDAPISGSDKSEKEATVDKDDHSVRELVMALLTQWKEYVSTVPQFKPSFTGISKLTKSEQRFLQRVTDLVVASNERAVKAAKALRAVTAQLNNCEFANKISMERLKVVSGSLNRYRRRCSACERVLSSDQTHELVMRGKLESSLKQSLSDIHMKHASVVESLRIERRDRMIQEVKRALEAQQIRKLQARVAELESRGSSSLRGRDEAIQSLESKLRHAEESMHSWFRNELPRLISGLPVTEDAITHFYTDNENIPPINAPYLSNAFHTSDLNMTISNKLISSLGMDRCYALAQALCASQAVQSVQLMRINGLTEVNSILKERVLTMEGVLIRWKDQIVQAEGMSSSDTSVAGLDSFLKYGRASEVGSSSGATPIGSGMIGAAYGSDHVIQQIYSYVEIETKLTAKVQELTSRVIELEEEAIEMRGKFDQASMRATEMKSLVDVVMADEQLLKTKATQQLTKIRMDLEDQHARELRAVRQNYEQEKHALISELKSVADAVEEAKLTTVDSRAWENLVASDERKNNEIDIEFGALERGILPKSRQTYHDRDIAPGSQQYSSYVPTPEHRPRKMKKKRSRRSDRKKSKKASSSSSSSSTRSSSDADDDDNDEEENDDDDHSTSSDSSTNSVGEEDKDTADHHLKTKKSQRKLQQQDSKRPDIVHVQREVERSRDQFIDSMKHGKHDDDDDDDAGREVAFMKEELTTQLKSIADGITALQHSSRNNNNNNNNSNRRDDSIDTMIPNRNLMSNHHHHPTNNRPVGDLLTSLSLAGGDLSSHLYYSPSSTEGSSSYPDTTSGTMHRQVLIEVQMENLERVLELERRKHKETQFEVRL